MLPFGFRLLSFILFGIQIVTIYSNESCINKKMNVKLMVYDKNVNPFSSRFSLIDEDFSKVNVKFAANSDHDIEYSFENVTTKGKSWTDNIIRSIMKRKVHSAFTDSPNYYYALHTRAGLTKTELKTITKFNLIPGKEDPLADIDHIYSAYEVHSLMYYRGPFSIRYSYIEKLTKGERHIYLYMITNEKLDSARLLTYFGEKVNLDLAPVYLLPIGDSLVDTIVIFKNGLYQASKLEEATLLAGFNDNPIGNILIGKGPNHINKVKALIRKESKYLKDEFYILDDKWKLYEVNIDVEKKSMSVTPTEPKYKSLVESISKRNALAAYSNNHAYYYAVEEVGLNNFTQGRMRTYQLFYGTQSKKRIFDDYPTRLHAVLVQTPRKLEHYSYYGRFHVNISSIYLHKSGDSYENEPVSNIVYKSELPEQNFTHFNDRFLPLYIIPSENNEYALSIDSKNKFIVSKLTDILRLTTSKPIKGPLNVQYKDCSKKVQLKEEQKVVRNSRHLLGYEPFEAFNDDPAAGNDTAKGNSSDIGIPTITSPKTGKSKSSGILILPTYFIPIVISTLIAIELSNNFLGLPK